MNRYKYPRTPHFAFSEGVADDDRVLKSAEHLIGQATVTSLKYDGENTSLYSRGWHARSLDSRHRESRAWLARFHGQIAHDIPAGWRVCGENLFARHSLEYTDLESYFVGFSVWNERNVALSWDDAAEFMALIGVVPARVLHRGVFDEEALKTLARQWDGDRQEGFVTRLAGEIRYEDFGQSVAKWVRKGHVTTDRHWMHAAVVPNRLAKGM